MRTAQRILCPGLRATSFRRMREDAGLTKVAVARAAGIDPTYLGYVEAGEREASLAVLCRFRPCLEPI